ncbi:uncharacterized protein LOC118202593, partial [Stegodyphus dumicola]|uniref:uncharacterized protein LOC118202593 n=1 Tax=Stegodyphus dumicola TaxID=202533 RepID=UPI0015AFCDBA
MVEELKHQMRSLENLIGCKGKLDVTSGEFIKELIRALCSKYQSDLKNSLRLHRLELLYDLAENIRRRHQKASVEEVVVLPGKKIKKSSEEEPGETEQPQKPEKTEKALDIVTVKPHDIDDWKDLMILSKIYYVMEHPKPEVLKWKRRISKKKVIQKFGDKDFIEWRVAQNFRLRSLEAWAQSRSDARRLVEEDSPLSEDEELDELGNVFPILSDGKQKKTKRRKEEWRKPQKPFKFKGENMEDWTESYSDDSEELEDEKETKGIAELIEEPESEVDDLQHVDEDLLEKAEGKIAEIFSVYRTFTKHRNPIFEEIDK